MWKGLSVSRWTLSSAATLRPPLERLGSATSAVRGMYDDPHERPVPGKIHWHLSPKRSPSAVGKRNQIDVCFLTHETRGQAAGNPEQTAAGHGVYLLLCGRF